MVFGNILVIQSFLQTRLYMQKPRTENRMELLCFAVVLF